MYKFALALLTAALISTTVHAGTPNRHGSEHPEWKQYFDAFHLHGAFVLYDLNADRYEWYNKSRCDSGFIPASTFKIVNSCFALESGVIPDVHTVFRWDSVTRSIPAWNHDQDMAEAFTNSTVWYYQEIARRVGRERMQHFLDTIGYGNKDISGKIDEFWLTGKLRITMQEEIEIIRRLYFDQLPFSSRTMREVKAIFPFEVVGTDTLFRKTGWGDQGKLSIGWSVGFLRKEGDVYFFAVNVETTNPGETFPASRNAIVHSILTAKGLLAREKK